MLVSPFLFLFVASFVRVGAVAVADSRNSTLVGDNHPNLDKFLEFVDRFQKRYDTEAEWKFRLSVFSENFVTILRHRLDHPTSSFQLGITPFADLTPEEFKLMYASSYDRQRPSAYDTTDLAGDVNTWSAGCTSFSTHSTSLPDAIDWRQKNAVSSVKDQGQCGSCWAFSSTGAIEGAWSIRTGQLLDLSEQELVDCAGLKYGSEGCNGGQMDGGFKYVMQNGQCAAQAYPYTSGVSKTAGKCANSCDPVVRMSGCRDVTSKDTFALMSAVAMQPVAVAIEADTRYFQLYTGGILDATTCGTNLDHGVLVVGYGEENGKKYWIVKNSWSSSWGENGYVRILRSSDATDAGICGIAMEASFPVA